MAKKAVKKKIAKTAKKAAPKKSTTKKVLKKSSSKTKLYFGKVKKESFGKKFLKVAASAR